MMLSLREKTKAHRLLQDDVHPRIKQRRLEEVNETFLRNALTRNQARIGTIQRIMIEKENKKKDRLSQYSEQWSGRSDNNLMVHFGVKDGETLKAGDFVDVLITHTTAISMNGEFVKFAKGP
jgi:tRNA A37 methylthiotransferase MiaB